jgi:hypothetical protein
MSFCCTRGSFANSTHNPLELARDIETQTAASTGSVPLEFPSETPAFTKMDISNSQPSGVKRRTRDDGEDEMVPQVEKSPVKTTKVSISPSPAAASLSGASNFMTEDEILEAESGNLTEAQQIEDALHFRLVQLVEFIHSDLVSNTFNQILRSRHELEVARKEAQSQFVVGMVTICSFLNWLSFGLIPKFYDAKVFKRRQVAREKAVKASIENWSKNVVTMLENTIDHIANLLIHDAVKIQHNIVCSKLVALNEKISRVMIEPEDLVTEELNKMLTELRSEIIEERSHSDFPLLTPKR